MSMLDFSLAYVGIISTTLQGALLGCATFMTLLTVFMLVRDPRRRRVNYGMITASCVVLALSITEFVIDVARLVRGFITVGPNLPGGTWLWFFSVNDYTFIIKGCLYPIQVLILDGVVIYRAYVAWQSFPAIIVPCVGYCALMACTGGLLHSMITIPQYSEAAYSVRVPPWINAVYASTLATNLSATVLLAFRIWRVNREASEFMRAYSRLNILLRVVIESGAIYTALNVALLVAFKINSPSLFYIRDIMSPSICMVFNMIVVRVGFASGRSLSVLGINNCGNQSSLEFPWRSKWDRTQDPEVGDLGIKSLAHEILQVIDADSDTSSRSEQNKVHELVVTGTSRSAVSESAS